MKRSARLLLSLLIAVFIAGGLTFLSFTTLFTLVEAGVYAPNLKAAAEKEVRDFSAEISGYLAATVERCRAAVDTDVMKSAFRAERHSDAEITGRRDAMAALAEDLPGLESVRLVDAKGDLIVYSTLAADITSRSSTQITYGLLSNTDRRLFALREPADESSADRLWWDGEGQRWIIELPLKIQADKPSGAALVTMASQAVENHLVTRPGLLFRNLLVVDRAGLFIDPAGAVSRTTLADPASPFAAVAAGFAAKRSATAVSGEVLALDSPGGRYLLYATGLSGWGSLGVLYPMRRFEMGAVDKTFALAALYVTVFLLVFLLGNLKQDPIRIVAQRMHQFQVEFLREFFEKRDQINVTRWQKEIDSRREEIKRYMKRGIKKLTASKETEIDSYIIDGWNEVVSIIKSKVQKPPEIDMARIESLLRKVLAEQHVIVSQSLRPPTNLPGTPAVAETAARGAAEPAAPVTDAPGEVEELLEEFEEAEPASAGSAGSTEASAEPETLEPAAFEDVDIQELEAVPVLELEPEGLEPVPAGEPAPERAGLLRKAGGPGQRPADEEIELLGVVPEIKELSPLPIETLPELEIVAGEDEEGAFSSELARDFRHYVDSGETLILSIEDLRLRLKPPVDSIVMSEGVYRINDELYRGGKTARKHRGLRALAQSLLETDEEGISGIDELYRNHEILADAERRQVQERLTAKDRSASGSRKMQLTNRGLDFDAYLETFAFQVTDKVMIYGIGEIIKKAKAVSAVLFTDDDGLKVTIAIGLTNRSAHLFNFGKGNFLFDQYLKKRVAVACQNNFQRIKMFVRQLAGDDLKFIRSGLFLPAVLEKKDAYVFLGFTDGNAILDLPAFLKKLDICLM